jgi:uncharacterized short protein YbdD (DUF466 family)
MRVLSRIVRLALGRAWWWLRQVSGDAAYENYVRRAGRAVASRVLSREEFYLDTLRRKYARVSRCC